MSHDLRATSTHSPNEGMQQMTTARTIAIATESDEPLTLADIRSFVARTDDLPFSLVVGIDRPDYNQGLMLWTAKALSVTWSEVTP